MTRLKLLLAAGTASTLLTIGAANAAAGQNGSLKDLPGYSGEVAHFTITPRGAIDGVILSDGTDVNFPPYLSTRIAYAVKRGDKVTVRGLKAADEPVIRGVSIRDETTHKLVVDNGPPRGFGPGRPGAAAPMMAAGKIAQYLYGPNGKRNGVLLEDGTALHLPPPEFAHPKIDAMLKPGESIAAVGPGTANELGRVVMVRELGTSFSSLTRIALPRPPHAPRHHPGPWTPHSHGMPHGMVKPLN